MKLYMKNFIVSAEKLRDVTPLRFAVSRLRYEIRRSVAGWPSAYLPLVRLKHVFGGSGEVVSKNTEILIEGFPRSANTFAVAAFNLAQRRQVRVARHLHAPAQVIGAIKMNIPAVVLIRDPDEAVLSHVIRRPSITMKQALRAYEHFYACLLPHRDSFVVGPFHRVVGDFGSIIRDINHKFSTSFEEFSHTESNVKKCFEIIEKRNRERYGKGGIVETMVARPSEERMKLKETLRQALHSSELAEIRARAYRVYRIFTSEIGCSKSDS